MSLTPYDDRRTYSNNVRGWYEGEGLWGMRAGGEGVKGGGHEGDVSKEPAGAGAAGGWGMKGGGASG